MPLPERVRDAKKRIGVVTQFDSLDPDFSCAENLRVYGAYFGLSRATIAERVPKLLDFAALQSKAGARPGELSGGMKRRLSLGRALVNDPDLLLLDEPTTGLDPQARHLMWERLQNLLQEGKAILLTTHFMAAAWKHVKANKGSAGVDGRTVQDTGEYLKSAWPDIGCSTAATGPIRCAVWASPSRVAGCASWGYQPSWTG